MSKNYAELRNYYSNMIDGNDKTITVIVPSKPNVDAVLSFLLLNLTFYDEKNPDRNVIYRLTTDDFMTKEALEEAGKTEAFLINGLDKIGAIICGFPGYEDVEHSFDFKDIVSMVYCDLEVDVDHITNSLRDLFKDMDLEAWNTPEFFDYLDTKIDEFGHILDENINGSSSSSC